MTALRGPCQEGARKPLLGLLSPGRYRCQEVPSWTSESGRCQEVPSWTVSLMKVSGRSFVDGLTQGIAIVRKASRSVALVCMAHVQSRWSVPVYLVSLKLALCTRPIDPRPRKVARARIATPSGMACMRVCARCTRSTPRHKQPCMNSNRLDLRMRMPMAMSLGLIVRFVT